MSKEVTKRFREPAVFPPYPIRRLLSSLLSPQILYILPQLLPSVPSWFKSLIVVLIAFNIKSFPGVWHYRVWKPVVRQILNARASVHPLLPFIRSYGHETTNPKTGRTLRLDALPLGKDIFEETVVLDERVMPDDCDYLGHLSNSCYAKVLDFARAEIIFHNFFRFFADGGRTHLGGSNFVFHKEIPLFSPYEVHVRVETWDEKWVYLVAQFTSPTDSASRKPQVPEPTGSRSPGVALSRSAQNLRDLLSDIRRPEHEVQAAAKAEKEAKTSSRSRGESQPTTGAEKDDYFAKRHPGSSGGHNTSFSGADKPKVIYCTAVSRYCFKFNRKTIPPWLVVVSSGFGTWASTRTNWDQAEDLRAKYCAVNKRVALERGKNSASAGQTKPHFGFLQAYDPVRAKELRENSEAQRDWMHPDGWSSSEWEPRRIRGLDRIARLGGLAPRAS